MFGVNGTRFGGGSGLADLEWAAATRVEQSPNGCWGGSRENALWGGRVEKEGLGIGKGGDWGKKFSEMSGGFTPPSETQVGVLYPPGIGVGLALGTWGPGAG